MQMAFFLFLAALAVSAIGQTYGRASNIVARNVVLYTQSTSTMPNQIFPVLFGSTLASVPTFAFGINQYRMGDKFYVQDFNSQQVGLNTFQVNISVASVGSTNPQLFAVSYIAISGQPFLDSTYLSYTSPSNISAGSGNRQFQAVQPYSFSSNNTLILPFITGFYITTTNYYSLTLTGSYLNNSNYDVTATTISDCIIHRLDFYVLIVMEDGLSNYFFVGGLDFFNTPNVNLASWTTTVNNYDTTEFVLAIRGLEGFPVLSNVQWGWSITTVNGSLATLSIDKNQVQNMYYSFFQIAAYQGQGSVTSEAPSSGGSLGIIAGLMVGIIVVSIIVFLVCKYHRGKETYKPPQSNKFKEMPSISL